MVQNSLANSKPRVSVALSVYNGERHLAEAIESVLNQTLTDLELLVLDDGSTDGTLRILQTYAQADPRVRIISRENRGLVASLNQLLDEAHAPVIARMDADDICRADRLERQLAFLDARPDHGVVGSWIREINDKGLDCLSGRSDPPVDHAGVLAALETGTSPLAHPSVMYRSELVRDAGGYRAQYRHCEDFDLWLRLSGLTKMANLPDRLVSYRRHPTQVSNRHALEQQKGAAIAHLAWTERAAGRRDPTDHLSELPPIDQLDTLFGRAGTSQALRRRLLANLVYSPACATDEGLAVIANHLRDGGGTDGLWRTTARLVRGGQPRSAARLALMLARFGAKLGKYPSPRGSHEAPA